MVTLRVWVCWNILKRHKSQSGMWVIKSFLDLRNENSGKPEGFLRDYFC